MWSRAQLLLALTLALAGCRGSETELPIAGDLELCCKAADDDDVSFSGCRATGFCRGTESVWIRGPLICSAATPDECADGRCCKLDLDALALRRTPPASGPSSGLQSSSSAPDSTAAPTDPADVIPTPLDWQGSPTPVFVPNFVCSATVERGISGTVLLHVAVDEGGRVTAVTVHRPLDPECDALARDALLHAEFEPALTPTGEPIAASMIWAYHFPTDKP